MQDVGKLQQILNNLLSNAIKFTPEGGRIASPQLPRSAGLGRRSDDGRRRSWRTPASAFRWKIRQAIFEKFRQGQNRRRQSEQPLTREYEGTGLGLSIVKELSKLLGGEVSLDSEFGKGSTFTVRLPLRLAAQLNSAEEDPFRRPTMELHRQQTAIELATRNEPTRDAG